jgi:hypothetical protein
MKRRARVRNYWGHRYVDVNAPKEEPTPEGYGLTDDIIKGVRAWKAERASFTARWTVVAVALAATSVTMAWGTDALVIALALGWFPAIIFSAVLHARYGTHSHEAAAAEFERAHELWASFRKPVEEHKQAVRPWSQLSGHGFERAVTRLLQARGLDARQTRGSGDGGVDIEVFENRHLYMVVQCKRYKTACGPAVVRDLYGAMIHRGACKAMLICLGGFTPSCREFTKGKPIILVDSKNLVEIRDGGASHLFRDT